MMKRLSPLPRPALKSALSDIKVAISVFFQYLTLLYIYIRIIYVIYISNFMVYNKKPWHSMVFILSIFVLEAYLYLFIFKMCFLEIAYL